MGTNWGTGAPSEHLAALLCCAVLEHLQKLPRACGVSSLETFRSHLAMGLGPLLWVSLLKQGWAGQMTQRVLPASAVLEFCDLGVTSKKYLLWFAMKSVTWYFYWISPISFAKAERHFSLFTFFATCDFIDLCHILLLFCPSSNLGFLLPCRAVFT